MGAYNSTYVGVFLEVPVITKEVEKEVLKNSKGKVFTSGKFDPETVLLCQTQQGHICKWTNSKFYVIKSDHLVEANEVVPLFYVFLALAVTFLSSLNSSIKINLSFQI
jgi:hypothetical protein